MKRAVFRLVTSADRHLVLSQVQDAIGGCGGWIVDHHLFSNIAATLNFRIAGTAIGKLLGRLNDVGLVLKADGAVPNDDPDEIAATIALTFVHDERDLKRDVPPFG